MAREAAKQEQLMFTIWSAKRRPMRFFVLQPPAALRSSSSNGMAWLPCYSDVVAPRVRGWERITAGRH